MQNRLGPNTVGPLGLGQSFPDAIKLILKEDFWLAGADKVIYAIAPAISALCSFLVMAVIPVGPNVSIFGIYTPVQLADSPVAMLFVWPPLPWASTVWCSVAGLPNPPNAVRISARSHSDDLLRTGPRSVAGDRLITAATMSTSGIVNAQADLWSVVLLLPAFMIFFVTMFGSTNRLPFDLPESRG